jgi:catechol 2,3-dioxygenase-like lactoylglutathione lyase family enzyme
VLGPLTQVARPTADLDGAVAFYRDTLGLRLLARFEPPGLAFFDLGGVRLLVEGAGSDGSPPGGAGVLYFRVDDIHGAHRALCARGLVFDHDPQLVHRDEEGTFGPPGEEEWMAFFRDPDGGVLALATRIPGPQPRS